MSRAHFHCSYPSLRQDCFDLDLEMGKKDNITSTFPNIHSSHTTFAFLHMACVYNEYTQMTGSFFSFF